MSTLTFISVSPIYPAYPLSGDYQTADFSDFEDSDDEREAKARRSQATSRRSTGGGKRVKECPGCSAMLPLPTKECVYCDYTFTSKSMVMNAQAASAESLFIQNRFPFEAERVSPSILDVLYPNICRILYPLYPALTAVSAALYPIPYLGGGWLPQDRLHPGPPPAEGQRPLDPQES